MVNIPCTCWKTGVGDRQVFHILTSASEEESGEGGSLSRAGKGGHAACSQQGRVASLDHHGLPCYCWRSCSVLPDTWGWLCTGDIPCALHSPTAWSEDGALKVSNVTFALVRSDCSSALGRISGAWAERLELVQMPTSSQHTTVLPLFLLVSTVPLHSFCSPVVSLMERCQEQLGFMLLSFSQVSTACVDARG